MNPLMVSLALAMMLAPLAARVRRTDRIQGNALSDSSSSKQRAPCCTGETLQQDAIYAIHAGPV